MAIREKLLHPFHRVLVGYGVNSALHVRRCDQKYVGVAWRFSVRAEHGWLLEFDHRLVESAFHSIYGISSL